MMYRAYYIFPPYNNKKINKENEKAKEELIKEEQKQKEI